MMTQERATNHASAQIRALVSGFPREMRKRRPLAMLQAFIDDSGIGQPPVFWLAGYVAEAEDWEAFSDEWAAALAAEPPISHYKVQEAIHCNGQFSRFEYKTRDEKFELMQSVLNKYINQKKVYGVAVRFDAADWDRVCEVRPKKKGRPSPYILMMKYLIASIYDHYALKGYDGQVDLIFDDQPEQMKRVLEGWGQYTSELLPHQRKMIGNMPIFRNDKTTMPIQAADLLAWWLRRSSANSAEGKDSPLPFWNVTEPDLLFGFIAFVDPKDVLLRLADFTSYKGALTYEMRPGRPKTVLGG